MPLAHTRMLAFALVVGWCGVGRVEGQARRGGAATAQGDVLRGEGVFLRGAGWYELNSAQGRNIDERTAERIANWNESYYAAQRQRWAGYQERKKGQSQKAYDEHVAAEKERQVRLRTQPTLDDVARGDALNALLLDLSDPKLTDTEWRISKVALPAGTSIKSIVYRFAPKPNAKGSESLSRGVIALSRLDVQEWPIVLRDPQLDAERKAYEEAYAAVRRGCVADQLSLPTILGVNATIKALKEKANSVVSPDLGYRKSAVDYVNQLGDATGMFHADTVDYASEIVKDTQEHDATTVGELLAFMRKYRLIFSSAESVPGGGDLYGQLYGAMRKQKEALLIKDPPAAAERPPVIPEQDIPTKLAAIRGFIGQLDLRNPDSAEKKAHKVAALKAIKEVETAIKARRSPRSNLLEAKSELEALLKIKLSAGNISHARSAVQVIDALLQGMN